MSASPQNPLGNSQASLSLSNSQSHSMTHQDDSLQTLVSHLLAAKRSLSSISTVWRANEIVTSARSALEESVVLSARTGFLRSGISEQVKILRRVRGGIEGVYKDGQRDFKVWQPVIWLCRTLKTNQPTERHTHFRCSKLEIRIDNGHTTSYNGRGSF